MEVDAVMKKFLTRKYYTAELPGSLAGKRAFHRTIAEDGPYNTQRVNNWLKTQEAYTLHKPVRKIFKRRRVIVHGIDDQFQADLVDLTNLAKHNSKFKYLLTCMDVFSKYAWAIPLQNKTGVTLVEAFKKIFNKRRPKKLQTDKGTEFTNKIFQNYLKSINVQFFTTQSELKASVVERFNRTLKTKMWRYFTAKNTLTYLDVLPDLMKSYNNGYHSSIKMAPIQVTKENEKEVYDHLYGEKLWDESQKLKFNVGDHVRLSKLKRTFDKGYLPNWTEEIFIITERIHSIPPVYKVKDLNGELIEGTHYEQELQAVTQEPDSYYKIEKIIREEKRGRHKYYLVKWQGYPVSFNSWVKDSDMKSI